MPPNATKPESKKKDFGKYGNPFIERDPEKIRHKNRMRLETMAMIVKKYTKDKRPISEIAAEISRGELKRETGI